MRNVYVVPVVTIATVIGLAGCGSGSGKSAKGKKTVCYVTASNSHAYVSPANTEFSKVAAAAGVEVVTLSQEFDAQKGADQIQTCIGRKPDAILVWSFDPKAYTSGIVAAKKKKIPIMVMNGPLDKEVYDQVDAWTGPGNLLEGDLAAAAMNKEMAGKGKIVVLQGIAGSGVTAERQQGFVDGLKKANSSIEILGSAFADFDQQKALVASRDLITKFGDKIEGVYAHDDIMAAGWQQAWKESGQTGKPIVIGMGGTADALANIKTGTQFATVYQSPVEDARLAFTTVQKLMNGDKIEPHLQYIPTPVVTKANVAEYKPAF